MVQPESFRHRAFLVLLLPITTAIVLAVASVTSILYVRASQQSLVDHYAEDLIDAEKLRSAFEWKVASNRGFFLTKDTLFLEREEAARSEFRDALGRLTHGISSPDDKRLFAQIDRAESDHQQAVDVAKQLRAEVGLDASLRQFEAQVFPKRETLRLAIADLERHKRDLFEEAKAATRDVGRSVLWLVGVAAVGACLLVGYLGWILLRRLAATFEAEAEGRREAEKALAVRGDFLTVAAHELRTPLAALSMLLQILERTGSMPIPDSTYRTEVMPRISRAVRQARRVGALIDLLLDATHISSCSLVLTFEDVDVPPLITAIVEEFDDECRLRGCAVEFKPPTTPLRVRADPLRLGQALRNLVSNAVKYGEGKPMEVAVMESSDEVSISVRDAGPGIGESDQERIFAKYERVANSGGTGGLGLGLYVARSVAEAHGGKLLVDSEPGKGSTFTLCIPKIGPAQALEAAKRPLPEGEPAGWRHA